MTSIKAKALAALRSRLEKIYESAQGHVWQHHMLPIDRDGVEFIPGKWYHSDETGYDVFGPYETRLEACEALDRYVEALELEMEMHPALADDPMADAIRVLDRVLQRNDEGP